MDDKPYEHIWEWKKLPKDAVKQLHDFIFEHNKTPISYSQNSNEINPDYYDVSLMITYYYPSEEDTKNLDVEQIEREKEIVYGIKYKIEEMYRSLFESIPHNVSTKSEDIYLEAEPPQNINTHSKEKNTLEQYIAEQTLTKEQIEKLTIKEKFELFFEKNPKLGWMNATELKNKYDNYYNENVNLSTISTYCARQYRDGKLARQGNRTSRQYILNTDQNKKQQKQTNDKSMEPLTIKEQLKLFIEENPELEWISTLELKKAYESHYGIYLNLSTASTYCARMYNGGILEKKGNRLQIKYHLKTIK